MRRRSRQEVEGQPIKTSTIVQAFTATDRFGGYWLFAICYYLLLTPENFLLQS